jgi:hypothetical protein
LRPRSSTLVLDRHIVEARRATSARTPGSGVSPPLQDSAFWTARPSRIACERLSVARPPSISLGRKKLAGRPMAASNTEHQGRSSMKSVRKYFFEHLLIAATMLLSVAGFWKIYLGENAAPNSYHHLHVVTDFLWLFLLLYQLRLIATKRNQDHRRVGLAVLVAGPLLFATTALLSVHSAQKGLASGQGDFLIVQNVMVTLQLGLLILLAFVLRKRRKLHGSLILSTAILFMGIALFFTLISFVPQFKIEGPETFYRFGTAASAGQATCLVVGFLLFVKDFRHGWPFLLAGSFFLMNELIRSLLAKNELIGPLTEFVGSMSQPFTFVGSFAVLLTLLAATGVLHASRGRGIQSIASKSPGL